MASGRLFSIGHSNHPIERFIELLRNAGVTAVADVRSQPYSQRYPHYNRSELEKALRDADIAYAFLGDQLGGRPRWPEAYDEQGRLDYERVRNRALFQQGLQRLCHALEDYRVAMLCAEEDPLCCHRGLLITPALAERGILPSHIRGDGRIDTAQQFEERLLAETGVGAGILDGLFAPTLSDEERRQLLKEAYRRQARRRSFRRVPDETDERSVAE